MSSLNQTTEPKRRASAFETVVTIENEKRQTFLSPRAAEGKHRNAGKPPIQEIEMIPVSQMSRRPMTSSAIHQHQQPPKQPPQQLQQLQPQPRPPFRPQPPIPGQVILGHPGRVQKQKIPPPVPVRKRKSTTTAADTTQNSFANTSAQNSTVKTPAQNSMANLPAQSSTAAQKPQDIQTKTPAIPEPTIDQKSAKQNGKTDFPPLSTITLQTVDEIIDEITASAEKNAPPKREPTAEENIPPKHEPTAKKELEEQKKALKETSPTDPIPPKPAEAPKPTEPAESAKPTEPAEPAEYAKTAEKANNDSQPEAIPPPPTRPRRASACNLNNESLLDPKDSLLIQRRSSSPLQTYNGSVDNEFLKSYLSNRKNASADSSQRSQSQPNSLNASQKTLNSNASQKSLNSNTSQKSDNSNASQKSGNSKASQKSDNSKASQKSANLNASQKTLNKTSTESLTNTNENETHIPIMVESIIITPDSNGKRKRQASLDNQTDKNKISQNKANDNDVASEPTAKGKIFKLRKYRISQSAIDLIESAPTPVPKKKSNKGKGRSSGRQDSNRSTESLSPTPSPGYNKKTMETPLLPSKTARRNLSDIIHGSEPIVPTASSMTKSASTPANLQTFVKFSGSNMTVHHRIVRNIRRSSNRITRFCTFRTLQVAFNIALLVGLSIGAFIYLQPPEPEIHYVNKTITNTIALIPPDNNPAPGYCVKVVVDQCVNRVPYNYTRFPSLFHVNQIGAAQELDMYDAIVDVRCYELAALFLCSVFVPKCGPQGELLYPCRSLCEETKRRCGFFLDVFGLPALPEYLMECRLLPDSDNPDICVGHREVLEAKKRAARPKCSPNGFQCDQTRCIPSDWRCDGHMDCEDRTDEKDCIKCANGSIHCGSNRCMSKSVICDGIIDCPYGQDERNCIRLHDKMGDVGRGLLQVYDPKLEDWIPACVSHWDNVNSANAICALMGYNNANYTRLIIKDTNVEVQAPKTVNISDYQQRSNWVKDFRNCGLHHYPIVNMECQNFECGRKRNPIAFRTKRIVGGKQSSPGNWPFLAAIHGGPEEIFYCAGVLIADQWVLTASHCVGNASEDALDGWKIQLGVTRRHSHSYYGQKASVKRVISHPEYNMGINHDNDIALFQLERPVTFTEHVLPVCLPPPEVVLRPGMRCTVIGWGKSDDDECSEYEPALHEVEVPIINRRLCNEWMIYRELNVTDGMICAGLAEGGKDACQGDSGGPLLCPFDRHKKRWFVGGIVSWGIKCAHPQLPGVYAYVPKFVPWIREMMEKYSDE